MGADEPGTPLAYQTSRIRKKLLVTSQPEPRAKKRVGEHLFEG